MKSMRKFFAIVLAIMILMGNVDFFQQEIKATSRSADEAINYVKSLIGQSIDKDGAYGAQCVDLILAYYDYLGVPRSSGNGADYTWNALPSGWQRIQGAQPQKGDILVYTGGTGNWGHVAIYEADRITYHQNIDGNPKVQQVGYKYNGLDTPYWGVIRPNWVNNIKPTFCNVTFSQPSYSIAGTVFITASANNNPTRYYMEIYGKDGLVKTMDSSDPNKAFLATDIGVGEFWVYVMAENSAGHCDSEYVKLCIYTKPTSNEITINKNNLYADENIVISSNSNNNPTRYYMAVYKNNEIIKVMDSAEAIKTFSASELGEGNYKVYVMSENIAGHCDSKFIFFQVKKRETQTDEHQEQTTSYKPSETTKPIETTREEVTKSQELISKKPSVKPTIVNKMLVIKKPVLTKVKNIKGKKAKLKIKKVGIHYNGYVSSKIKMEIMYARDKKFKKGRKIKTVKGYNFDTSKIISKLKKKKYYFKFRVRIEYWSDNYKTNYKYSSWSNVKKVRIKK